MREGKNMGIMTTFKKPTLETGPGPPALRQRGGRSACAPAGPQPGWGRRSRLSVALGRCGSLARALPRAPRAPHRLLARADGRGTLRWKDSAPGTRHRLRTRDAVALLRRCLRPLFPAGCQRLRHDGGARTGSARRSAGGGVGCVSRRCAPPCRCLLTAKLLPHRPSRRREALRASVGRWPGWTRSAASPTSARGGGHRWAGILPDRPSRWADHVPRSVGEHVGSRTDAGRRTPSVHCGMPSLLLPARGWLRLGVRRSRILLPGDVLPTMG